jgi:hypothetical protein
MDVVFVVVDESEEQARSANVFLAARYPPSPSRRHHLNLPRTHDQVGCSTSSSRRDLC